MKLLNCNFILFFLIIIPINSYAIDDANVVTNQLLTTYVNPTAQAFKNDSWQLLHSEDGYSFFINPFMSKEYLNIKPKNNNNLIIATLTRTTIPSGDTEELPSGGMTISRVDIDCTDKEIRGHWSHMFDHNDKFIEIVSDNEMREWHKSDGDELFDKTVNFACHQFLPNK
ncbi:hypothetical protein GWP85_07265 [Acinetobacter beijerinckii]|uniref:hypothetical protein n=1 Tax=Acinetobacter beijerinckii TaxID=262668 RepID=UPI0023DDB9EB|nr:hypothetical protein [Acinetobacter beijerinckii]MDF2417314.1 hypothetical protein [Acinetobacter beijerinckii]